MEKAYEGKVKNVGAQEVKAPYQHKSKDSGKVHYSERTRRSH